MPGGPYKNDGTDPVGFDGPPEQFAGTEDVTLTDEVFEGLRTHPRGQWRSLAVARLRLLRRVPNDCFENKFSVMVARLYHGCEDASWRLSTGRAFSPKTKYPTVMPFQRYL